MATTIDIDFNSMPHAHDYFVRQGDNINHPWELKINDGVKDLTACTLTLTVESADDTAAIAARPVVTSGVSGNRFSVLLTAVDTAALSGLYRYEIKCVFPVGDATFSAGATRVILAGSITVEDVV